MDTITIATNFWQKSKLLMYLRYRNYFDLFATHYGPAILTLHLLKNLAEKAKGLDLKETALMLKAWKAAGLPTET